MYVERAQLKPVGAADSRILCARGAKRAGGSYHRVHARLQVRPLKARSRVSFVPVSARLRLRPDSTRHARITLLAHDTTSFPSFRYTLCRGRPFNCASLFIAVVKTCPAARGETARYAGGEGVSSSRASLSIQRGRIVRRVNCPTDISRLRYTLDLARPNLILTPAKGTRFMSLVGVLFPSSSSFREREGGCINFQRTIEYT